MPRCLADAQLPRLLAQRIWTTALTAEVMRNLDMSWALNAPGFVGMSSVGDGAPETLLDRAEAWLAAQQLPDQVLQQVKAAAERTTDRWRIKQVRPCRRRALS